MNIQTGTGLSLKGQYKISILDDATNQIVWEQPDWSDNMILNNGIDRLFTGSICASFEYALVGTGSRVNNISSGVATASVIGKNLLLYPSGTFTDFTSSIEGYSSIAQFGDIIKFNDISGSEMSVVSSSANGLGLLVTSSWTNNTLATDYTGISGSFTLWKTSQNSLQYIHKLTNTYVNNLCGTDLIFPGPNNRNYISNWRTYDFTAETGSKIYTEVGVGFTVAQFQGTFARMILQPTASLTDGQKLRMHYKIQTTINPITAVSFSANVSGWPVSPATNTSGSYMIMKWTSVGFAAAPVYNVTVVTSSGTTLGGGSGMLEPFKSDIYYWISTSPGIGNFGTGSQHTDSVDYIAGALVNPYSSSAGSLTQTRTVTYTETQFPVQTGLRSCGFGTNLDYTVGNSANSSGFVVTFDQGQTKTDVQLLTLTYRVRWNRTLSS